MKRWFESYWWSPNQHAHGRPWTKWLFNRSHKTLKSAIAECAKQQAKQPETWFDVREVRPSITLKGSIGKGPRKGPR